MHFSYTFLRFSYTFLLFSYTFLRFSYTFLILFLYFSSLFFSSKAEEKEKKRKRQDKKNRRKDQEKKSAAPPCSEQIHLSDTRKIRKVKKTTKVGFPSWFHGLIDEINWEHPLGWVSSLSYFSSVRKVGFLSLTNALWVFEEPGPSS